MCIGKPPEPVIPKAPPPPPPAPNTAAKAPRKRSKVQNSEQTNRTRGLGLDDLIIPLEPVNIGSNKTGANV